MSRSKWKGPYTENSKKQNISNKEFKNNIIISRDSEILPNYLGLNFNVYNGKTYSEVLINDNMIGHKFGEFSFTRAKFIFKKKKKNKTWVKKQIQLFLE